MSSFIRKNPRLSGVLKSDESVQSVPVKTGIPGLSPSLTGATSLLASTGIPDLDVCLGGGLPPASLLTVFEDFPASKANFTWSGIVRCFLAEGVATASQDYNRKDGGWIAIVGHDITGILSSLPKPEISNSSSSSSSSASSSASSSGNLISSSSQDNGNVMKIAWRYEGMKEFDSNLKRPISSLSIGQADKTLGHTFDLGRKLDGIPKQLSESSRALHLDLSSIERNFTFCHYKKAWEFIKEAIQTNLRSGLGRIVIGSLGAPGIWNCTCDASSGGCGQGWLCLKISNYIQEIEASQPCLVLITIPTAYLTDKLVINTKMSNSSMILPSWIPAIENVSDAVIELKPLLGISVKSQHSQQTKSLLTNEYDGFLIIRKSLRRPNSFKPILPETANLAFKIKRRRFCIEKFHLPPSLDDSAKTEPPTSLCSSAKSSSASLSTKTSHSLDF